jgi:predicted transcriptional regulator
VILDFGKNDGKNRSRLEIVRDMLRVVSGKARKTRIMYQANLNFNQMEKYLDLLLRSDLVEYDGDSCYSLTSRGEEFLKVYACYVERVNRIRNEVQQTAKDRLQLESIFLGCYFKDKRVNGRNELGDVETYGLI